MPEKIRAGNQGYQAVYGMVLSGKGNIRAEEEPFSEKESGSGAGDGTACKNTGYALL